MRDRLFLLSGILGVGTLAVTLLMSYIGPHDVGPMAPGFRSPALAFEFARSEAEVRQLFEPEGSAAAMDRLNRWDFLYMALYGGFLTAFALAAAQETDQYAPRIAAGLAPLIALADVMENVQLFSLTRHLELGGDFGPALGWLRLFTWLKWAGLAIWFLLIGGYFRELSGRWRFVWLPAGIPALLAVWAFINPGQAGEMMVLSIGVMFLALIAYAWWRALTHRLDTRGA